MDKLSAFGCLLAALIVWPIFALADEKPLAQTFIAKSTTVFIADAASHTLQSGGTTYVPAGTRFIAFDRKAVYKELSRRLILTEDGLWAYISDSDEYYWDADRTDLFRQGHKIAIMRRPFKTKIDLSPDVQLQITLTASEAYQWVRDTESGTVISVGAGKIKSLTPAVSFDVTVPPTNVSVFDPDLHLSLADIRPFEESLVGKIRGIAKPCGTKETEAISIGGSGGIDVNAYIIKLNLDAGAEIKKVTEFGSDINVRRLYYSRKVAGSITPGYYVITNKQGCTGDQAQEFGFNNPNNNEISFDEKLAKDNRFPIDKPTGQFLVTCPDDYFRLEEFLEERDFDRSEAAFAISRIVRFRNFSRSCTDNSPPT